MTQICVTLLRWINSLSPGIHGCDFKCVNFKDKFRIDKLSVEKKIHRNECRRASFMTVQYWIDLHNDLVPSGRISEWIWQSVLAQFRLLSIIETNICTFGFLYMVCNIFDVVMGDVITIWLTRYHRNAFYSPEINGNPIVYIGDLTFEIRARAVSLYIGLISMSFIGACVFQRV